MSEILLQGLATLAGGLVVGWLVGRYTGAAAARSRDLGARVESLRKECEQVTAELAAAKARIEQARAEQEQYRNRVSDHFAGASERFRELSLQYRSLFEHLSEGARALCGDGFAALEGDLVAGALPARAVEPAAPPQDDAAEAEAAAPPS